MDHEQCLACDRPMKNECYYHARHIWMGERKSFSTLFPVKWNGFWLRHFVFLNTLKVALYVWGGGGCGGVRMRVVWRGYCLSLLAPFPLEAVFTMFLDSLLLLIRHAAWDEQGWWVGQNAKQIHVLQEKPNCFLRGCFSEMEGCALLALTAPVPSLECCHLVGWCDSSFNARAWGAVEWSWKRVALLLLVCSSRKWSPHRVGNGLQTSHISWKNIPTSSVPRKLEGGGGKPVKGRERWGKKECLNK